MTEFAKELNDMMASYNTAKDKWVERNGSDIGFNEYILSEFLKRNNG